MAIKSKDEMPWRPIEIDLTGPDGNVFYLMGLAKRYAKQLYDETHPDLVEQREDNNLLRELGLNAPDDAATMGDLIVKKMMESDYENALNVFDSYFGKYVIMYR